MAYNVGDHGWDTHEWYDNVDEYYGHDDYYDWEDALWSWSQSYWDEPLALAAGPWAWTEDDAWQDEVRRELLVLFQSEAGQTQGRGLNAAQRAKALCEEITALQTG